MENIWKELKREQYKWIVFGTLFGAVLAHGYILTNKISFHDDICSLFSSGGTWKSGRWGLGLIETFLTHTVGKYSIAYFNGVISIILIALSACLVVSLLNISNKKYCFAIGAIMVVFPVVSAIFMFMFTAPSYFLALLLIIFSVWLTERYRYGWLGAVLFVAFSLGIYQGFWGIGATIIILCLVNECMTGTVKKVYMSVLKHMGAQMGGLLCYFQLVKLFLRLTENHLTGYMGIDSMMEVALSSRLMRLKYCFTDIFSMLFKNIYGLSESRVIRIVLLIMFMFCLFSIVLILIKVKTIILKVTCILLFIAMPIGINLVYPMTADGTTVHSLMMYPVVGIWIAVFYFLQVIQDDETYNRVIKNITFFCCLVSIIYYSHYDNIAYMKVDLLQEQTTAYYTTLIAQIKSCEGYRAEMPVAYIGMGQIEDPTITHNDIYSADISVFEYDLKDWINDFAYYDYMKYHCGFAPEVIRENEIEDWTEIDLMPVYPDSGSVKVVDGYVAVKFSER